MVGWLKSNVWDKVPMWSKIFSGVVGTLAALWLVIGWAQDAYQHFETTRHHDQDIQLVLDKVAEQTKSTRISENRRELGSLQRQLVGEKYSNEGEKALIVADIQRLEKTLLCDEQGVCQQ